MSFANLRSMLIKYEGIRLKPYKDTVGKLTIGVGRNIEDVGITHEEAMMMLAHDIDRVSNETCSAFTWYRNLNIPRQDVVLNMIFNLGMTRFQTFQKLIAALIVQNYDKAADEMLNSVWASQVGRRAVELAQIMRSGIYV